jgi:hypothetical protein
VFCLARNLCFRELQQKGKTCIGWQRCNDPFAGPHHINQKRVLQQRLRTGLPMFAVRSSLLLDASLLLLLLQEYHGH